MSNRLVSMVLTEAAQHAGQARRALVVHDPDAARLYARFAGIAAAKACGLSLLLQRADTEKEVREAWTCYRDPFSPTEAGLSRHAREGAEMWVRAEAGTASRRDLQIIGARRRTFAEMSLPREDA